MIRSCGAIWGPVHGSYLYAVVFDDCLYLGETSSLAGRWAGHLRSSGSSALHRAEQITHIPVPPSGVFAFFGFHCDAISAVADSMKKIARRAVEEELHRQFLADVGAMRPVAYLLSTPPPPPVRHLRSLPFDVRAVARAAYVTLVEQHRQWRGTQP